MKRIPKEHVGEALDRAAACNAQADILLDGMTAHIQDAEGLAAMKQAAKETELKRMIDNLEGPKAVRLEPEISERIRRYRKDLAEVSKKHGLFITSCDCCSAIEDENGKKLISGIFISYDKDEDSY